MLMQLQWTEKIVWAFYKFQWTPDLIKKKDPKILKKDPRILEM